MGAMVVAAVATAALAKLMEPVMNYLFQDQDLVLPVALAVLATFTLRGVAEYIQGVYMNGIGQGLASGLQQRLYHHLLQADLAFFHQTPSGQLVARLTNDVIVMRGAMAECITGIAKSLLTLVLLVAVMFYQDWLLASCAFAVFPAMAWFVFDLGKKVRRVSARIQGEWGRLSALLNQTFQGIRYIKAYEMEASEGQRGVAMMEQLRVLLQRIFRFSAISTPIGEILGGLAIASVIVYGSWQISSGHITIGGLMSFITAFLLSYEPMKRLAKLNSQLQTGLAALERIFQLLDWPARVVDRPCACELVSQRFDIQFQQVEFCYPNRDIPILSGISLKVEHGRSVALVGHSGAGKSTILNLIPRFYDISAGAITIGGHDLRQITLSSLRSHIALVSQESTLFDDTIRANIAYGTGRQPRENEIIQAAQAAAIHDFISALPAGYDTIVGESGVNLSGGQRQRVAIARALLRNSPVLLLDEATSSLDAESERLVQEALRRLRQGRTTLLVAHRLSSVLEADHIFVLAQGRVVEAGTHATLLAQGGLYGQLYGQKSSGGDFTCQ